MPSPGALGQVPVFKNFLKWFSRDEYKTDNVLFEIHHRFSTAILMFGLTFVFLENHIDKDAINCRNANQYAQSYCWIHGTGYVKQQLQGSATGCFVDQSAMTDQEWNGRVTAYYLWIPFLITFCIGFTKLPRVLWKNILEGGFMRNLIQDKNSDAATIATNFLDLRKRCGVYHLHFAFCEILNIVMVVLNMFMCDILLVNKFWSYGVEVLDFLKSYSRYGQKTHNPMCELFPTEVACYITVGATTGGDDVHNYLCILSNNIFNQKYFLIIWIWWVALLFVSVLGLVYRAAKMFVPGLSRRLLRGKGGKSFNNLHLSKAEYFVLGRVSRVVPRKVFKQVIEEIEKKAFLPDSTQEASYETSDIVRVASYENADTVRVSSYASANTVRVPVQEVSYATPDKRKNRPKKAQKEESVYAKLEKRKSDYENMEPSAPVKTPVQQLEDYLDPKVDFDFQNEIGGGGWTEQIQDEVRTSGDTAHGNTRLSPESRPVIKID